MRYSVIIPAFNRADWLVEAINSVYAQNHSSIEIIVVDDGSTDNTRPLITGKFPGIHYLYQENQGPSAARNRGIQAATGEIVALLDSDDLWLPGKIAHELALFQQFPSAGALAGNARSYVLSQLRCLDTFQQRGIDFPNQQPRLFDWEIRIMELGPTCCTSAMVFKRSTLDSLGKEPFDNNLRFNEDWDLEFRLFSLHQVILYPEIYCRRRIFDDGTRCHYPLIPDRATDQQQREILNQQHRILGRYINTLNWDAATRRRFEHRRSLLQDDLSTLDNCNQPARSLPDLRLFRPKSQKERPIFSMNSIK
ncbi:MAG: glycosyltransferase family 2 protein [Endozoicomonas sp.]